MCKLVHVCGVYIYIRNRKYRLIENLAKVSRYMVNIALYLPVFCSLSPLQAVEAAVAILSTS